VTWANNGRYVVTLIFHICYRAGQSIYKCYRKCYTRTTLRSQQTPNKDFSEVQNERVAMSFARKVLERYKNKNIDNMYHSELQNILLAEIAEKLSPIERQPNSIGQAELRGELWRALRESTGMDASIDTDSAARMLLEKYEIRPRYRED
jgi:hypothetical protein